MPDSTTEGLNDWGHEATRDRAEEETRDWAVKRRSRSARTRSRRLGADGHAASVAAWFEAHQDQLFECERHNGRARLTMQACAERYRRAAKGWVNQLRLSENRKQPLRMSFAVCAACPVGAYNFRAARLR